MKFCLYGKYWFPLGINKATFRLAEIRYQDAWEKNGGVTDTLLWSCIFLWYLKCQSVGVKTNKLQVIFPVVLLPVINQHIGFIKIKGKRRWASAQKQFNGPPIRK